MLLIKQNIKIKNHIFFQNDEIINIHEFSNVRYFVDSSKLEASKRMTYELHSDIINQSLNIQALSIALCQARVHACVRT